MKTAGTCIILKNGDKILGVTRKYDHTLWGLPGGKLDTDETPLEAIIRETKEETGLDIRNIKLIDNRKYRDRLIYLYIADWSGSIQYDVETEGKCDWITWEHLISGPFGEYNKIIKDLYF
jgi:8-oxo-dGTP pyrophosphatase MutT (NUDIX family)